MRVSAGVHSPSEATTSHPAAIAKIVNAIAQATLSGRGRANASRMMTPAQTNEMTAEMAGKATKGEKAPIPGNQPPGSVAF